MAATGPSLAAFLLVCLGPTSISRAQTPSLAPAQANLLVKNEQGYEEYLWLRDSSVMVRIPAGTFIMGTTDLDTSEKPPHRVFLNEYYMDKYEVTNRQFRRFCDATGRGPRRHFFFWRRHRYPRDPGFPGMPDYFTSNPDYPVLNVTWGDAAAYCRWAGKSLPTEAQWEKAARGGDARRYPWGNDEPDGTRCNFADRTLAEQTPDPLQRRLCDTSCSDGHAWTSPVGSYPFGASPYGCLDLAGNVWEWCQDRYGWYGSDSVTDPRGPATGDYLVARGGCWRREARLLHSAFRHPGGTEDRVITLGFRCAYNPQPGR